MYRRLGAAAGIVAAAALLCAHAGGASSQHSAARHVLVGIVDDAQTLYGDPDHTFPILKQLRVQVVRVNLWWGGRYGVAKTKPQALATNPNDPAYDWQLYDRVVRHAHDSGIKVLFSVVGTPTWSNPAGSSRAPRNPDDLKRFAFAAATRYSGSFKASDGSTLPPVRMWLAWNEPNNPVNLYPQYKRVGKRWVIQSAVDYAKICAAVYAGVHATKLPNEKVACGGTSPRGNNSPGSSRPSVSPLAFLRALKTAGLKSFDAYAHHPYYGSPTETPSSRPKTPNTAVVLGNLDDLVAELTRLYGPKRIWLTEYGYQTNPPDTSFGVSWKKQSQYLTQAFAIARKNPRVDLMCWFLLRDDSYLPGWQSGLFTSSGVRKPAFNAFAKLPH
ncbi:MAG: hypothetical protein QOE36_1073 [Gaiellaceae bacterium]|nr:hypothetical protein [Gaiellaceae bacterium]